MEVSFEVSTDGKVWAEIIPRNGLNWLTTGSIVENQTFDFAQVDGVSYLRMKIHNANLKWAHYAINELEVLNVQ